MIEMIRNSFYESKNNFLLIKRNFVGVAGDQEFVSLKVFAEKSSNIFKYLHVFFNCNV